MPLLMWSVQINEREPHSVKPGPRSIHRHADNLAAALALPEDFDGDRFDRVRRSHAAYFCAVSAAIILASS